MNVAHGIALCAGEESYRRYLHRFLVDYQPSAIELQLPPASRERIRHLAHQLKSTASYLGLEKLAGVAREADVRDCAPEQLELARQRLHVALTEAMAAITAFLALPSDASPG